MQQDLRVVRGVRQDGDGLGQRLGEPQVQLGGAEDGRVQVEAAAEIRRQIPGQEEVAVRKVLVRDAVASVQVVQAGVGEQRVVLPGVELVLKVGRVALGREVLAANAERRVVEVERLEGEAG